MKIILDCNVIIAAGLTKGSCFRLIKSVVQDHYIICSKEIFSEYIKTVQKKKFTKNQPSLSLYLKTLFPFMHIISMEKNFRLTLPDKNDEMYLHTALTA